MLQNIRDKSQGLVLWIVVILIIGTFALWGIHNYVSSSRQSHSPAVVNHQVITESQVLSAYDRLRQQQQMQLGANFVINPMVEAQLKKQALNQLVISTVLIQSAHKAGYRVTTEQVDEALLKMPAFQENGQFSVDRFHEILHSILYSQDNFLNDMRGSMLINQVQSGYVNTAFALPGEVTTAIRLINQKRDINYAIISASRFASNIDITPLEIKNYYQTHQAEFQSPEQVSLEYLELSLPKIKEKLVFDEAKVQQYYENNMQNYIKPASWHVAYILIKVPKNASPADIQSAEKKIQDIQHQLKMGEDFGILAKKYSQDYPSAKNGGELNWFSAGSLDPAFEKAVANLNNINQISEPVRTSYGYSIIKLLGVKKSQTLAFKEVKDQVESAMAEQQAEQTFSQETDKLANLTYANPTSLTVAAKALGLNIKATDLFGREGAKSGIGANTKIINTAFSPDVLQNGNNSDVISLDANTAVVIRVKNHQPQTVLPFADVENMIAEKLRKAKAQEQAESLGKSLLKKIQAGGFVSSLNWQVDKEAGRYDSRVDSRVLNEAFSMPYPNNKPSVEGLKLPSGDYAIIEVKAVHQGELPKTDNSENISRNIFKEELERKYGLINYQLYVRESMADAKIKVNDQALNIKSEER